MSRKLTATAGISGFIVVALGAFGAHALGDALTGEQLEWWRTATLYGLTHAAAALAIALGGRQFALSGWLFIAGLSLFCATLYAMALGAPRILGAVTPVRGLAMLAGWTSITVTALRAPKPS